MSHLAPVTYYCADVPSLVCANGLSTDHTGCKERVLEEIQQERVNGGLALLPRGSDLHPESTPTPPEADLAYLAVGSSNSEGFSTAAPNSRWGRR